MNTFPKSLFFFGATCLLAACSSGSQNPTATFVRENAPTLIDIDKPAENSRLDFSIFASSVEYIPLDDNEACMISSADKVEVTRNGDIIIFDRNLRKIARFDSTGHFLNCIAEIGHGPGEIVRPIAMTYDPYTDHLFVNDNGKLTLMEYDLEGKLIRSENPIPFGANEIGILDASHYCFYSDFIGERDGTGFNYHITDNSFKTIGCFEPFTTHWDGMIGGKVFMKNGEHLYSRTPASNYIYEVTADTIIPLYQIEYHGDGIWISEKNADQLREKCFKTKGASKCIETFISDKYLIIILEVPSEKFYYPQMAIYNRKNGETITGENYYNDLPNAASSNIHSLHDNRFLTVCFPEDFQRVNEALQSDIDFHTVTKLPMDKKKKQAKEEKIKILTPFAQKTNATLQITHLK